MKVKAEAKRIAALRITANPAEKVRFEQILFDGARVIGPGFSSNTVRIAVGGQEYFVFVEDLQAATSIIQQ